MADVASRDLRNNTRALLERVEAGESITITVDGRPVATLRARRSAAPVHGPRPVRPRRPAHVVPTLLCWPTCAALAPDSTDDLPLR